MKVIELYYKVMIKKLPVLFLFFLLFIVLNMILMKQNENVDLEETSVKIKTALVNYNGDHKLTQDFLNYMEEYCEFYRIGVGEEEIFDALYFKEVDYVLQIPYQFGDDFMNGEKVLVTTISGDSSLITEWLDQRVTQYFDFASEVLFEQPLISVDKLLLFLRCDLEESNLLNDNLWTEEGAGGFSDRRDFLTQYYDLTGYFLLFLCFFSIISMLHLFHNNDFRSRIMISPFCIQDVYRSLFLGNIIFVLIFDVILILCEILILQKKVLDIRDFLYGIHMFLYSVSAFSMSYLFGMLRVNHKKNTMIQSLIPFVICFVSGVFVPQSQLHDWILTFAQFTPVYWFVAGNGIISKINFQSLVSYTVSEWLYSLKELLWVMGIQIGYIFAIASFTLVIQKYKKNRYL